METSDFRYECPSCAVAVRSSVELSDFQCRRCCGDHLLGALKIPNQIWEVVDEEVRTGWFSEAARKLERLMKAENLLALQFPPKREELEWVCEARFRVQGFEIPVRRLPQKEMVLKRARELEMEPDFIAAYWDGDSSGWFVCLSAFALDDTGEEREELITTLQEGGDARVLFEDRPHWPEARFAQEVGQQLADSLQVPFRFDSPGEPHLTR